MTAWASLSSIKSTLTFKPVPKDRLFYDRFRYCIAFSLDEASCLRQLDHEYIDSILERRIINRDLTRQRWTQRKSIITGRWKEITVETAENLHTVCDVILNSGVDYKCVVGPHNAWVYSNELSLIENLGNLPCTLWVMYTEAVITRPKNTLKLKNPKHTHRSYFKLTKLNDQEKEVLINFFNNQREHIRLSPGLIRWIESPFKRTQDYFFIDYNEESWLVMLSLIRPGLIRKTVEIQAA